MQAWHITFYFRIAKKEMTGETGLIIMVSGSDYYPGAYTIGYNEEQVFCGMALRGGSSSAQGIGGGRSRHSRRLGPERSGAPQSPVPSLRACPKGGDAPKSPIPVCCLLFVTRRRLW
jgi:hypothetical protein